MRVCELAAEMGTTNVDILKRAGALEIDAYSSLSKLDPNEVAQIKDTLKGRRVDEIRRSIADRETLFARKREAARKSAAENEEKSRDALRKHLERARAAADAAAARPGAKAKPAEQPPKARTPEEAAPAAVAKDEKPAEKPLEQAVAAPTSGAVATVQPKAAESASQTAKPTASKPAKPARPRRYGGDEELDPDEERAAPFLDRINRRDSQRDAKPARPGGRNDREGGSRTSPQSGYAAGARAGGYAHQNAMGGRTGGYGQTRTGGYASGAQQGQYGQQRRGNGRDGFARGNDARQGRGPQQPGRGAFPQRGQPGRGAFPQRGPAPQSAASGTEQADGHVIPLRGAVVVKDFAEKLGIRPNRLIADLMQMNILASINQRIEIDVATRIAEKYGFKVELERQKRSTERRPILRSEDADDAIPEDKPEEMVPRPPVVTFLGHVDHGKTSLMDRIRKTHVAAGEAGGITQAISAYSVEINGRAITFLDTPGHAAFSAMRMRGANMTDIAVIVIAADDGIMPQTKEAIADARQAGVQIMVAINKCDLPNAKPDRVRQMLQGENLTPEEWGGDVICCEVSALTGDGIDHLLEMILLQADMLELQANPNRRADGYVIEAELEQGLGPTAAMLVSGGTLKVGDILLCGQYFGKVRALIDDKGRRVKSVGPAMAAKCMGLSGVPEAGAPFRVMLDEKRARALAEKAAEELKQEKLSMTTKVTSLDDLLNKIKSDGKRELSVIVKADTQGSAEAIGEALRGIVSQKVSLSILYAAVGNVCETDVNNAGAGKSIIVGFNIGCESGVQQKARHDAVRINTFRIIYELIDHVKKCMLDLLPPEYKEVVKGHAYVKAVFDIGKLGRVAGCQMQDGILKAKGRYRIFRNKEKLWEGRLASLKHFQNEVSEVTGSQECGIHFNGFEGFQPDDVVECYEQEELPRTL